MACNVYKSILPSRILDKKIFKKIKEKDHKFLNFV